MKFPQSIHILICNHLTARAYALIRASDIEPTPATLSQITGICNEPDVYEWLFHDSLEGKRYPVQKAHQWLEWSREGWSEETHFVFAVVDEHGEVAAACDIKSCNAIPEIGYWASRHHRGIMNNAVLAMSSLAQGAGFKGLFARAKIGNTRSQAVLQRTGFQRIASDDPTRLRFNLHFTP